MEKVYKTEDEVVAAIQEDGRIEGVVAVELYELIGHDGEYVDDQARERLVGSEFAYSTFNPIYSVAGIDKENNMVYLNVSVDANQLRED